MNTLNSLSKKSGAKQLCQNSCNFRPGSQMGKDREDPFRGYAWKEIPHVDRNYEGFPDVACGIRSYGSPFHSTLNR